MLSGLCCLINLVLFKIEFMLRYFIFVIGFFLVFLGQIYSFIYIRRVSGKKNSFKMTLSFLHNKYRFVGMLLLVFIIISFLVFNVIMGEISFYRVVFFIFGALSLTFLTTGEFILYKRTSVFSDLKMGSGSKEIGLMRDDISVAWAYTDILNMFLSLDKSFKKSKTVNDAMILWSEEHPVLFEDFYDIKNSKINTVKIVQHLDRLYEKERLSNVFKEFSMFSNRLLKLYGSLTSLEYAKQRLADSYLKIKERYENIPIIFDVLRSLPEGVLEDERFSLLSREELESKVRERTKELTKTNIELQKEVEERKKAEGIIKKSLEEKEVLLKEIHHRVKNNLQVISSLLDFQAEPVKDEKTLEMLKESQNRVRSMALVHEQLYQSKDFIQIDFEEYLNSLIINLSHSYGINSDKIRYEINAKDVFLNIDQAIACGFIINELVSNSLKHAFPKKNMGKITINLNYKDNRKYVLTVKDDGVGMSDKIDFKNTKSLGLQLVNMFIQQLNGNITVDVSDGTSFTIEFLGETK